MASREDERAIESYERRMERENEPVEVEEEPKKQGKFSAEELIRMVDTLTEGMRRSSVCVEDATTAVVRFSKALREYQKKRLIKILSQRIYPREDIDPVEALADYLLDNGVIVMGE